MLVLIFANRNFQVQMFSEVSTESTARLLESKAVIEACASLNSNSQYHLESSILQGTVYVLLYGALEYTITHCSYTAITQINSKSHNLYDVQPSLWAMIFDSDCTRMESNGTNKKWEYRYQLFSKLTRNQAVSQISNILFPSSNGNIKEQQIKRVWDTFGLKSPMFEQDHQEVRNYLINLAEGRMAVAHGREKASERGAMKSISELNELYNAISRYCSYLINCFNIYIVNEDFLQKVNP